MSMAKMFSIKFNSESDNQSRSSSKIPQVLDRNAAITDLIIVPREVRHHTVEEDEHHTRLGEHAAVLWKFNKITDITVKLNDEKYPAHKTVLSCYSRYFKDMLLKSNGNVSVINLQLEAVTNEAFSALLQYMYTADLNLTCQNIGDVYTAARKLGMDGAIDTCAKILKGKDRRDVHSVYVFVTAKKLGLEDDASRALRSMCRRFEQIVGTQEYLDLSYEQVVEYLGADTLATRSEVIVYLAALKWLSVRYLDREQHAVDVISCVRFPMMNLNEVLACHSPPLLPGLVEMPAIREMLLRATCFVASKTINEEKRFQRYDCPERTYLLNREAIILWDPSIFDPDRHALYTEEVAASTIQASFRDYKTKRALREQEEAAEVIQKAYRRHSQQQHKDQDQVYDEDSSDEESEHELVQSVAEEDDESGGGIIVPFAEKVRRSITSLFRRSSPKKEVSEESINETRAPQKKGSDHRHSNGVYGSSSGHTKRSSNWKTPYETTSIVVDLEGHTDKDGYSYENSFGTATEEEENCLPGPNATDTGFKDKKRSKLDAKQVEKSVAKLAKTVNNTEEDTYGAIVISGGFNGDNADHPDSGKLLLIYEPAVGEWSQLGKMHKPRHHHRIVYLKGFIYCIGGCNPERTKKKEKMVPLKSCYSFDMSSRTWNKIAEMRHCRVYHATAVLNGKIYVAGGKDENDCMLDSVEVYHPDSNSWDQLYDPLEAPTIGAGVCSRDGKLWVVGGMSQDSTGKIAVSKSVNCYDPETKKWSRDIPSLPFPRAFVSAVVCGSRVYVVGGSSHAGPSTPIEEMSSFDDVLYYDDVKQKWKNAPRLPSPRHFVGAVAVYKSLFVLGGLTSFKKEALDDILLFNDGSDTWVLSSHLPAPLCGFGAVSVPKIMLQKNK